MDYRRLNRSNHFPYHVCSRTNNKVPFALDMSDMWLIFSYANYMATSVHGAQIHAFVMMNNHFHLVVSTPFGNLDQVMQYYLSGVTRFVNRKLKRRNHYFGGRYRRSLITSALYYRNVVRYCYQNPIRAGAVNRVEEYDYSSLRIKTGTPPRQVLPSHLAQWTTVRDFLRLGQITSKFSIADRPSSSWNPLKKVCAKSHLNFERREVSGESLSLRVKNR